MWKRKQWLILLGLLLVAACFRIAVAHWLANDNPDDGRVYAQIARDVVERHVYSQESEAPYDPTLIRAPGYPLFLAAIYAVFGHTNNGAIRIVQALVDTGTCALVALLAFLWQPDERRKSSTAFAALALATVNPFTTIYAATILPEVPTMFLAVAICVTATIALRAENTKRSLKFWCVTGLLAGTAVLFRPDSGLFAAAIGMTLLVASTKRFWSAVASVARHRFGLSTDISQPSMEPKRRRRFSLSAHSKKDAQRMVFAAAVLSFAFAFVLMPWTIRNWRVFHLFQPLAPVHAEMPDEFIPHGYIRWLKTWLDDPEYINPLEWQLDIEPINVDDLPDNAFDSDEERDRVEALFHQYNHPFGTETANADTSKSQPQPSPTPQASPTQMPKEKTVSIPSAPTPQTSPPTNANSNAKQAEETGEQNENSNDEGEEEDEAEQSNESNRPEHTPVKMTPEIDAAFGQIAAERIARHPLRYYLSMPAKRARALWFNPHSDYYPFEGALLPLDDLDHETHQHIWLPLFAALVGIYTILGIAGGFILWASRDPYARLWLLLAALVISLRLAFFSTLENPEPRYVVEFFPFLAILGGIVIARVFNQQRETEKS